MIVFKTFWNIINKYKGTIIMYTILLIIFGGINSSSSEKQINFVNTKPDILIINNDTNNKITNNLISYIEENSNIIDIDNNENAINDALFYRDVNYIIYIPNNYSEDIKNSKNPTIDIKSTGDYQASLAEMMLTRYLKIQNIYSNITTNEEELITLINNNLKSTSNIQITSKLDSSKLAKSSSYFTFASYSIMSVIIFIICLVISSFKESSINKRTIISSTDYKKLNRNLLLSSCTYALIVWIIYIILAIIMNGSIMFTTRGLIYMINSLIFTFCSLTIALLISNLITNKNAVSGIVNVVSLGSAFLCGAFVPAEWLPKTVLRIAHILPSYWYINTNDLLKTIEVLNIDSLTPIITNSIILLLFSILFIILNNIVSRRKLKYRS